MNNDDAIEKLADIIRETEEDNIPDTAKAILAAILTDPMAYGIKPKPLVWIRNQSGGFSSNNKNHYWISYRDEIGYSVRQGNPMNYSFLLDGILTFEAAKAKADEDYCAQFAAMIGEPQ